MSDATRIDPVQSGPTAATGADASAQKAAQLKLLAAQFESILMSQMLKDMRSSIFGDDDNSDAGFATGPLGDAMYSQLSLALSQAGGFGLGAAILDPLSRQAEGTDAASALSNQLMAPSPSLLVPDGAGAGAAVGLTTLSGPVSSGFGWRRDPIDGTTRFHNGTDIAVPVGEEVPAARAGRVSFAGEMPGYGLTVTVDHGGGLATRYAHLSEIDVKAGDQVAEGQPIAKSGATGRVTGPHLHFEVLEQGQPVDSIRQPGAARHRDPGD